MVDYDAMRGMHNYYGDAEPLFDEAGEFVGLDEDMPTEGELDLEHLEMLGDTLPVVAIMGYEYDAGLALRALDSFAYHESFLDWLDANYTKLYDANGDETDYYGVKE